MRQVSMGLRSTVQWLGWLGFVMLILAVIGLASWWNWDRGRQVPLPPQAQNVSSEIMGALAKRTTFVVPASVAEVRDFYRQTLPRRGWSYCGTQATAGCTNLVAGTGGTADQVDVYRRADDQASTGTTIEVWPAENPRGGTAVAVYEANPAR